LNQFAIDLQMVWIRTCFGLFVMWIKSIKYGRNSGPIVGFEGVLNQFEIDLQMVWIRTCFGLFVMWIKSLKFGRNSGPIVGVKVFESV
jgi:hypothetical protein